MEMAPSFSLNDLALKIDGIDAKIDALIQNMNTRFAHIDTQIAVLVSTVNQTNERITRLETRFDRHLEYHESPRPRRDAAQESQQATV